MKWITAVGRGVVVATVLLTAGLWWLALALWVPRT